MPPMFRSASLSSDTRRPLRRAAWMASGLIALWLVMQFVPKPGMPAASAPPAATVASVDPGFDTGTVARSGLPLREERGGFSMGYVVALLILGGGAWLALKLRRDKNGARGPANTLHSLGTLTLTPGQTLHLVACGTDVLLVGQGANGVSLLATYPRDDFEARPRVTALAPAVDAPASTPAPSFGDLLRARAPHLFVVEEGRAA